MNNTHPIAEKLSEFAEKVYAYALSRTYSRDEADDLSQEILLTALRSLPKLRDASRFEPWLWGIAANVTKSFRRAQGRQRSLYVYDAIPADIADPDFADAFCADEDEADRLCDAITHLSALYRDILLLHYYDGLGINDIAERLGIPPGTVSWRLSEARRKLKKEFMTMTESTPDTTLRPATLRLDIYGSGNYWGKIPFPDVYINDALSQNICLAAYESARTVEDLSKSLGVPAFYLEERLDNLVRRNAVVALPGGKFRTDFIIWQDKHGQYMNEAAARLTSPFADTMADALLALAKDALRLDFYRADYANERLTLLFAAMAMEVLYEKHNPLTAPEIPPNYDGFAWRYIASMETGAHPRRGLGRNGCSNSGSRGHYSYTGYNFCGFAWQEIATDTDINVCEDILTTGQCDNPNDLAFVLEHGWLKEKDGVLQIPHPMWTRAAYGRFTALTEQHLAPLMPAYCAAVRAFAEGFAALFPAHLADDVARQCRYSFLTLLVPVIERGQATGIFYRPAPGTTCAVMVERTYLSVF